MVLKNIIGFIIYIIIFVLFIPLFFYNKKKFLFLEVYLPNLDLIANLLTWIGGPMYIWKDLYYNNNSVYSNWSQILINYMSLLGMTFIVAREAKKRNNIIQAWSYPVVMILMTYLLPSDIVNHFMKYIEEQLHKYNINNQTISRYISFSAGLFLTSLFIVCEKYILFNYRLYIVKGIENIIKYMKEYLNM